MYNIMEVIAVKMKKEKHYKTASRGRLRKTRKDGGRLQELSRHTNRSVNI